MQEYSAFIELLVGLAKDPLQVVLFVLLVSASVSDWRTYRIPNWLTFGGATFALVYAGIFAVRPGSALIAAMGGLMIGFAVLIPVYALGAMGAGDVKLMAMVGAFLGVDEVFYAVIFSFIAGGFAAFGFAIFKKRVGDMLTNAKQVTYEMASTVAAGMRPQIQFSPERSIGKLPYGICISVGTVAYVLGHRLGFV